MPYDSKTVSFSTGDVEYQDLKEYFRRPRLIASGSCAASQANLYTTMTTYGSVFNIWFPGGVTRLEGVAGVRFNMVFTMTVAANPFHSGVLCMSYQHDCMPSDPDVFARGNFPPACTMLPHVRLDVAQNTMATLDVPWLWPIDYLPLDSSATEWVGHLAINNIVPCPVLPSSPAPVFKVYLHLENLELIGASPVTEQFIAPQSGLRSKQPVTGTAAPTAEKKYGGLISTSLEAASNVTTALTRAIPSLAAIGGPTAWGLRWASRVASAFGYSKPRDERMPQRVFRSDYIGESHVDMPTAAYSLSASAANTLRVDDTFAGTDIDEMALDYLLTKYSQLCLFQMSTTDTVGTRLWGTNTCLYNFWFRSGTTKPFCNVAAPLASSTGNCYYPSGLMYWSNFFRMWRGGLKFRFTFGKSKFHAGRVIVGFVPYPRQVGRSARNVDNIAAVEVSSTLPQPFSYTHIFDLKDGNEFEFEVPYLSPHLWTSVNGYTGGVTMTVLDPLIANGESPSTISVLAEVCAMPGFEFAVPCPPSLTAVQGNVGLVPVLQSGLRLGATEFPPINVPPPQDDPLPEPQSGLGVVNDREVAEYTVGETIRSVKQLLMIPSAALYAVTIGGVSYSALPNFTYLPRLPINAPMTNDTRGYFATNRAGLVSACFAYYQGSTAYDVHVDNNGAMRQEIYTSPLDSNFSNPAGQPQPSIYGSGIKSNALKVTTGFNALHVVAPLYSFYARVSIRAQYYAANALRFFTPGSTTLTYGNNTFSVPILYQRNNSSTSVGVTLNISGGDDARVSYYLGPPVVFLYNTGQVNSPDFSSNLTP